MQETLAGLIDFAAADPRMDTGCLFYKMRAGKHQLGPEALARVKEIDAAGQTAYVELLQGGPDAGELPDALSVQVGAMYLDEQLALAITQRVSGEDPDCIYEMMTWHGRYSDAREEPIARLDARLSAPFCAARVGFRLKTWLWGVLDRFTAVLIATGVTADLMVLLVICRRLFAYGSFEWLLCRITNAKLSWKALIYIDANHPRTTNGKQLRPMHFDETKAQYGN
ncbi:MULTISPECIES: hypothetical protein [Sulfitobacter]|uniref:hypothetical protein n=1 Tax=Sulfitobacter TaxID=60136 RepID=UPI000B569C01|nr:hypothetical protein [Sulfitobacter sp. UBA1132]OUS20035.1 hypothetical protein A9Q95_12445 [Rhodobacterales bacterium 59_46_T64]